ncbi:hypothetical protein BKA70DRAFT_1306360 [Coprinopsis sp. MPI-PUGE-AT-0042]|nr:hypothetical protein BKA70DRAFT_1306360 [Coprinopsis sp. MPI-PUGE-AT-0042]
MRATGILLLLPVLYAQAQVTLFLPGFSEDPQDLVADVAGTDAEGHTTFIVHDVPGVAEGEGFGGTATIIQGPSDASFIAELDGVSAAGSCSWTGENSAAAVCTFTDPAGQVETVTTPLPTGTAALGTTVGAPEASSGASASSGPSVTPGSTAPPGASSTTPAASGPSGTSKPATPSSTRSGAPAEASDDGSASRATAPLAMLAAAVASYWLL